MDETVRLRGMMDGLDVVLAYAEGQEDFVLAAKCEDVRLMILDRLSTEVRS